MLANEKKMSTVITSRSLKVLKNKAYPTLINRTASSYHSPANYEGVAVEQKTISDDVFTSIVDTCMDETFWSAPYLEIASNSTNCDSEASAVNHVKNLLDAVIKGLGIDGRVRTVQNRTLAGVECDILLEYIPNRLPFATVEVKKPPNEKEVRDKLFEGSPGGGNKVAGQVYAQMKGVHLFGFKKVYGLLTTFNQFRLFCTDDIEENSDNIAEMRKALDFLKPDKTKKRDLESLSGSPEQKCIHRYEENEEHDAIEIHGSQLVPDLDNDKFKLNENYGEKIVQLVVLFILKASTTLQSLLLSGGVQTNAINLHSKMPCRILRDSDPQFAFSTWTPDNIDLAKLKKFNKHLEIIYVIHHLGMGNFGNCCLGTSKDAATFCAIKFYHTPNGTSPEEECRNWNAIYNCDYGPPAARIIKAAGNDCLVMPYLMPISKNDRKELIKNGEIKNCLEAFVQRKYMHLDVKWCHFRRWDDVLYLVDLGEVRKLGNEDDPKNWVKDQMSQLDKVFPISEEEDLLNSYKRIRVNSTESESNKSQSTESMESLNDKCTITV